MPSRTTSILNWGEGTTKTFELMRLKAPAINRTLTQALFHRSILLTNLEVRETGKLRFLRETMYTEALIRHDQELIQLRLRVEVKPSKHKSRRCKARP